MPQGARHYCHRGAVAIFTGPMLPASHALALANGTGANLMKAEARKVCLHVCFLPLRSACPCQENQPVLACWRRRRGVEHGRAVPAEAETELEPPAAGPAAQDRSELSLDQQKCSGDVYTRGQRSVVAAVSHCVRGWFVLRQEPGEPTVTPFYRGGNQLAHS